MAVPSASSESFEERLQPFLEELATDKPAPGGGSVAAAVVAMAAGLVEKTALISRDWDEGPGVHAQAKRLRQRALSLADEDAAAYGNVLRARRGTKKTRQEHRDFELGQALSLAADVPLVIAETAADVAELAARAAELGNPALRGDAAAAATFAHAAARAGANLVVINLGMRPEDNRLARAQRAVEAAEAAAKQALAPSG
ncbi:MAG: cyclodeaminase/cyclohydrolase family protein [Actinomycetota bacterium]|nr:cyclodeaminase/cyclohydrolase family protein [Actinomycetota bacterium]